MLLLIGLSSVLIIKGLGVYLSLTKDLLVAYS